MYRGIILVMFCLLLVACSDRTSNYFKHLKFDVSNCVFDTTVHKYNFQLENFSEFQFEFIPIQAELEKIKVLKLICSYRDLELDKTEFFNDTLTFWEDRYGMFRYTSDFEIYVFADTTIKSKKVAIVYPMLESPITTMSGELIYTPLDFGMMMRSPKTNTLKLNTIDPQSSIYQYILNTTLFFSDEILLDSIVIDQTIFKK